MKNLILILMVSLLFSSCKDKEIIEPLPPLEVDPELVEFFAHCDSGSTWKYVNLADGRKNELRIAKKYNIKRNRYDRDYERRGYKLNYEGTTSENFYSTIRTLDPGKFSVRIDYKIGGGPSFWKENGEYYPEAAVRQLPDTMVNDIKYEDILILAQNSGPYYTKFVFAKKVGIIAYTDSPKYAYIASGTYVLEEYSLL